MVFLLLVFLVVSALVVALNAQGNGPSGASMKHLCMIKIVSLLLLSMMIIFLMMGASTSEMYSFSLKGYVNAILGIKSDTSIAGSTASY